MVSWTTGAREFVKFLPASFIHLNLSPLCPQVKCVHYFWPKIIKATVSYKPLSPI